MRFLSLLSLTLTAAILIAGCKSNSTSPNGGTAITAPNAGSYFITVNTSTDSTGLVTSIDTDRQTVIRSNASLYGMTGVMAFTDSDYQNGVSPDTTYLKYESNGDVEEYTGSTPSASNAFFSGWITFPFGSQTTVTLLNIDTVLGFGERGHITETVSGAGAGNVTVLGQSFNVNKAKVQVSIVDTTSLTTGSTTIISTASFAPALGNIVQSDQPAYRTSGVLSPSSHSQMISYHLQ